MLQFTVFAAFDCSVDRPLRMRVSAWQCIWGVYTIQQTSSKLPANVFKIHVLMLDICWIV